MTKYMYTFHMDDGRVVHVEDPHDADVEHILEHCLGKRCALATTEEPQPSYSNSVMTGFMVKA